MARSALVILVGGFNSAVDKQAFVGDIVPGTVMRLRNLEASAGGKGLHVALACAALGEEAALVGLVDEVHAPLFRERLASAGVAFAEVRSPQPVRTCLALRDAAGRTTEFLEPGPRVDAAMCDRFSDILVTQARRASLVVLSGSLPPGAPADLYATLVRRLGPGVRVCVDTSGEALRQATAAGPFVLKPNADELEWLVGRPAASPEETLQLAADLARGGPRVVVASLGEAGAAVVWEGRRYLVEVPALEARNPVGAGDCLLAGFAVGLARGWPPEECLAFAAACGSAKVLDDRTGHLPVEEVEGLRSRIRVRRV